MKESIGNAFVFGIFITFAFLLLLILTYAINYSRANKIKNKLLNYIASYAEYNTVVGSDGKAEVVDFHGSDLEKQIDNELASIGYRYNEGGWNQNNCSDKKLDKDAVSVLNPQSNYHYCIYAFETTRGYYYGVKTFMYFDIPIIGQTLEFPIYGETRVIYALGDAGGNKN